MLPQRGCRLTSRHRCHPWSCFRADSSCPSAHSPTARGSCASCTRAPGITSRATRRAQLHAPPAPSSRPPVPVVPAEGRRRHASRPPAHTRAGECRAAVCSEGRRAHRASSTCAGRSRRATARRSSPAAPPAPDGKLPGRRTPSAARPPAFPPDLDLRHQRRPEEDLRLCGERGRAWRRRALAGRRARGLGAPTPARRHAGVGGARGAPSGGEHT